MNTTDVLIIGGAAIGSSAAYFLASQPDFNGKVTVVEQDVSYAKCATSLSAASIRHQFSTPQNIQLSQFGSHFIKHIADYLTVGAEVPDVAFHERGYLFLATDAGRDILLSNHRIQKNEQVDVDLLTPQQLRARYEWLNVDDLAAGSLGISGEGWLDAYGLMQAFKRKAISLGVKYLQARATELNSEGNAITGATLSDGNVLRCGTVINAAGIGAAELARTIGISLPVQARKRSIFFFTTSAQLPGCPMVIDPTGAYFRPEGNGFICGIAPPAHDDPECYDFDVQHHLFEDLLWPILAQRVPGFESLRVQRSWAGHYDMNVLDHNLILGAHPEVKNLLFANGFSGHGMQQSPAVGRALSELVTYGEFRALDLKAFGWDRVLRNQPLLEINIV